VCLEIMFHIFLSCRLMPDSALTAPKEKKLTGRQYFESGRHAVVCYPRLAVLPLLT
jgi:hypothetical protein